MLRSIGLRAVGLTCFPGSLQLDVNRVSVPRQRDEASYVALLEGLGHCEGLPVVLECLELIISIDRAGISTVRKCKEPEAKLAPCMKRSGSSNQLTKLEVTKSQH